ncbi:MAG: hypothetical protein K2G30_09230, partial [Muribaculaceae bacterium]|nr:hypothetical protein [Muribaculaceae bacterium]
ALFSEDAATARQAEKFNAADAEQDTAFGDTADARETGKAPQTQLTGNGELDFAAEYEDPAPYGFHHDTFRQDTPPLSATDTPYSSRQPGVMAEGIRRDNGAQSDTTDTNADGTAPQAEPGETAKGTDSIVFTGTEPTEPPFGSADSGTTLPAGGANSMLSVPTLAGKRITNIVVFYSDNSFQSFSPATN